MHRQRWGGAVIASHHSAFFKIDSDGSVPFALETRVTALTELMPKSRVKQLKNSVAIFVSDKNLS
jgi:hypothetical protein